MFGAIGSFIMEPLYFLTSVVLVGFHKVFGSFLDPASGISWLLSIIGLTVVIRAALIPLFVKQIRASRNMQLIQPKVKELQKKYGHDRQKLAEEQMKLFKESGTNPFASCMPLLLQMPIFFALFRLLDHAAKNGQGHGVLSDSQARLFADATIFGGKISSTFLHDDGSLTVKIIAGVLVLAMTATTFLTQRQLMSKNMPADALTGQYAQQQKMLLYVLPVVFGIGGIAFPIGVLIYWTTSNLWTMGQQFWVIRNNPAPGTPAYDAKVKRDREKGLAQTTPVETEAEGSTSERRPAQRQQPKRQTRSQRKQSGGSGTQSPASDNSQNGDDQ